MARVLLWDATRCGTRPAVLQVLDSYLLSHLTDALDAGAVQVAVVLAGLDEAVALDVLLHLLP